VTPRAEKPGSADGRPPSRYVHGTSPEEQRRLDALNRILNDACMEQLSFTGGERIVDFGSGLGQLTRAMARAAGPAGNAVGIERSPEQISEAIRFAREAGEQERVEFRQGDVFAPPIGENEWGTFDLAHARFLLEHVPDPLAVVRIMVRAVRPGGRIVLADDDHDVLRFWPEPQGLEALWRAYVDTYSRAGNDPYVGRKLPELLHQAGARPVRSHGVWFGGCSGSERFPLLVANLGGILEGAREEILAGGRIDGPAIDTTLAALREWGTRPDAGIWFSMAWIEGTKPA
jgi:SAM-dependent methyltransferase